MIKTIIVEDDEGHSERLLGLLKNTDRPIKVLQVCTTINEALEAIGNHHPELVFLDILLDHGETGFDLLKKADNLDFEVIFTTSYNNTENAIAAIRACALDFLPKPVNPFELNAAVERFVGNRRLGVEQIRALKTNLDLQSLSQGSFWIPIDGIDTKIEAENALYCKSANEATFFFLQNEVERRKKHHTSRSIGQWEKILDIYNIVRIHNEYLVNIKHVISYMKGEGGSVKLKSGETLPVSKTRKEMLLKRLGIK